MSMKKILITISALALVFFAALSSFSGNDVPEAASLWGKYNTLIGKIKCPDVKLSRNPFWQFGFKEYGYANQRTWCKGKKGKAGYYVYVKPYWYAWKKKGIKVSEKTIASLNRTYKGLQKKLKCPSNAALYKKFTDYGYTPEHFKGKDILWCGGYTPPGHFVYVKPYWYVWKTYVHNRAIPPKASKGRKYTYSNLLQVIKCPEDRKNYEMFYEYGLHEQNNIYCGQKRTAPGYWMYVYPNWYIWKDRKKKEDELDGDHDNWPPK